MFKVTRVLSDLEATIWAYFAVCMSCCLQRHANQTFHFQTYD